MASGTHYFGQKVIEYFSKLNPPDIDLPANVQWIHPYASQDVMTVVEQFYNRYYASAKPRIYIYGINPGRFGAGVTGISFTDPVRLIETCQINHQFHMRAELSSIFIYDDLIEAFGGPAQFYQSFYITSVCPLGFTMNGKNYNYYDSPKLLETCRPFIIDEFHKQMKFGSNRSIAFTFGKGKNYQLLQRWNEQFSFYDKIEPLPHPRWIMQYKRKHKKDITKQMVHALNQALVR